MFYQALGLRNRGGVPSSLGFWQHKLLSCSCPMLADKSSLTCSQLLPPVLSAVGSSWGCHPAQCHGDAGTAALGPSCSVPPFCSALQDAKKKYDKETEKYCGVLEKHLNLSSKKKESQLQEVRATSEFPRQAVTVESFLSASHSL